MIAPIRGDAEAYHRPKAGREVKGYERHPPEVWTKVENEGGGGSGCDAGRGSCACRRQSSFYIKFGMKGSAWTVETLDATVTAEIEALPADVRARLQRVAGLIREHGLAAVGEPHVKHIEGKLWEMRARGRDGIGRVFYVAASGPRVVIVRAFVKKTQKAPRREIELALWRARAVA